MHAMKQGALTQKKTGGAINQKGHTRENMVPEHETIVGTRFQLQGDTNL
jgi:hypothetical protein